MSRRSEEILALGAVLAFTLLAALIGCGGGSGPTSPQDFTAVPPAPVAAVPAPIAATPAPAAELSYVELNEVDGSGIFCALPKGGTTAFISYASVGIADTKYGTLAVPGIVGKCVAIPPAAVSVLACGKVNVQIDVNQDGFQAGRHMGHAFVTVASTSTCPKPTPTPSPSPSPTPPPQCTVRRLGDKNVCFTRPLGNPDAECAYFGLVALWKDDDLGGKTFRATRSARLAIVKGANCYKLYENVKVGDLLSGPEREAEVGASCIDISHVTYCGCE